MLSVGRSLLCVTRRALRLPGAGRRLESTGATGAETLESGETSLVITDTAVSRLRQGECFATVLLKIYPRKICVFSF